MNSLKFLVKSNLIVSACALALGGGAIMASGHTLGMVFWCFGIFSWVLLSSRATDKLEDLERDLVRAKVSAASYREQAYSANTALFDAERELRSYKWLTDIATNKRSPIGLLENNLGEWVKAREAIHSWEPWGPYWVYNKDKTLQFYKDAEAKEKFKPASSLVGGICRVAEENTHGMYYCTRDAGHEGPCAAVPDTCCANHNVFDYDCNDCWLTLESDERNQLYTGLIQDKRREQN